MPRQRGFTLAELMVAVSISLVVGAIAAYAFMRAADVNDVVLSRTRLDLRAQLVMDMMRRDLSAVHPGCLIEVQADSITFAIIEGVKNVSKFSAQGP